MREVRSCRHRGNKSIFMRKIPRPTIYFQATLPTKPRDCNKEVKYDSSNELFRERRPCQLGAFWDDLTRLRGARSLGVNLGCDCWKAVRQTLLGGTIRKRGDWLVREGSPQRCCGCLAPQRPSGTLREPASAQR